MKYVPWPCCKAWCNRLAAHLGLARQAGARQVYKLEAITERIIFSARVAPLPLGKNQHGPVGQPNIKSAAILETQACTVSNAIVHLPYGKAWELKVTSQASPPPARRIPLAPAAPFIAAQVSGGADRIA
jgi:hypothetical protein